ncbi:VWA domain-containing protein [Rehaibacterium terrae]|uniref:Ca-activated chloride channel family protein n=1 Tax=Rehaibacterium terrae TaxID=1341696 RepID=A0A7W7Y100_9GAMM|nr:VWA domain-containing protein [Rehaibacterium terrae]MBB5016087.1 Ca-activated chloride channel family protein [Rehaibacterium terrae]
MNLTALWPHFLRPEWFWAVPALPVVVWLWRRRQTRDDVWRRAVDPHLLPALLEAAPPRRRHLGLFGIVLAWTLAVTALAGPAWRQQPVELWQSDAPLVVALELSSAMSAADTPPSRLLRARLKLAQLLELRQGGPIALLAYAGDAFTVAPLTDDVGNLRNLLDALDPTLMPVDGQRGDRAIAHARTLLANAGHARGDILLIASAFDDPTAVVASARAAHAAGIRVSALAVGTPEGAPVRQADGGFVTDGAGRLRIARLDGDALRAVAEAGGGRFAVLQADASDLQTLDVLDPRAAQAQAGGGEALRWHDAGYWLLPALLALALLGFRRGVLMVLLVGALWLPAPPVQAVDWAALWLRDDQRAWRALQDGDAEQARRLAHDPALAGAAAYRQQDWEAAIAAWSQRDDAVSHYNRGNALAQAGRFDAALQAYDEALARDPDFADAAANRQALRDWLAQQPPPEAGAGGEGEPGEPDEKSERAQGEKGDASGESSPPEEGDDSSGESGPQQGAEGEQDSPLSEEEAAAAEQALREAMQQALEQGRSPAEDESPLDAAALAEEEQRRAIEQWLRRVPDDPGGLLRRKFALEYQRRLSEGHPPR